MAEILRQEAEREASAREKERAPIETQPDLGLDLESEAAIPPAPVAPRRPEPSAATPRPPSTRPSPTATPPRRDQLPDIDEINSTLRAAQNRSAGGTSRGRRAARKRRSAFRRGFALAVLVAGLGAAAYVFAPQIAQAVPEADPWLSQYVAQVDVGRDWLATRTADALRWLDEMAAPQGS